MTKGTRIYAFVLEKYEDHYRLFWKGKKYLDEDNKFNVGKDSFLVEFPKKAYFDKKGLPVFYFVKGNAITATFISSPPIENYNHGVRASSTFFDHMFRRHLWRDSITSALKENKKMTWQEALPYMLGAGGICLVIGLELAKYVTA